MQVGISSFFNPWLAKRGPVSQPGLGGPRAAVAGTAGAPTTASMPPPAQASAIYHPGQVAATYVVKPMAPAVVPAAADNTPALQREQSGQNVNTDGKAEAGADVRRTSGTEPEQTQNPAGSKSAAAGGETLSPEQQAAIDQLQKRDRQVRQHEAAHQAVGGKHAGAASFSYDRGPDGVLYAVGGEVPVDVSVVAGEPLATMRKMRTVRAAALAPANPSGQDRAVAAQATQAMIQAQAKLAAGAGTEQESKAANGADSSDSPDTTGKSSEPTERQRLQAASAYATVGRTDDNPSRRVLAQA